MRAKAAKNSPVLPDVKYKSLEVAKLINRIMKDGKKSVAQTQIYNAIELLDKKIDGVAPIDVLLGALGNIKPKIEVRSRRIGGAAYQVPMPVIPKRQFALSIRWLVEAAKNRSSSEYHSYGEKLAAEIIDAYNNAGAAIKKRDDVHRMAEANKAFSHFRW